jgi:adenylate cyclase
MERKLTAILSADVKGYSRLMGEDEEATIRTLTAYREVMTTLIQQHRGRVVDSPGDNLLAEFASAVDALRCAVEVQNELKVRNAELPAQRQMEFRMGINVGDIVVEGERLYGDGVNIAARLEGLAEPGGICISGTVYDQVKNKLALGYEYLGEQTVKNIAEPVRAWRVRETGAAAPTVERRSEDTSPLLPLPDKPSIAVLPFTNMSGDPEQEYFSDGITEDLITDLSRLSGLFVIARHSVFTYKGKAVKVQEVSKELGVRYVLEGSVRKANNRVRITAQLVDATTGHHLWAERYDRELIDIFILQDEIVQKIVTTLRLQLTVWERGNLVHKTTANLEAYDAFLRGVVNYWRLTQATNIQARQLWEQAVELDPQYAEAYAWLGWSYLTEWSWQWSQDPQTLERAFALAQRALALDDSLTAAHMVLGSVYLFKGQHEQAIAEGEQAIALDPNFTEGLMALAGILIFAGRPEGVMELIEKALRLSPHAPAWYITLLGSAYRLAGRDEEAIATYKRALLRTPDFLPAHLVLATMYSELGREEEARAEAAEILRINPNFSLEMWRQTTPLKDQDRLERSLAALRKAGLE